MQTPEGAKKARQKLIEKHGGEEGYRAYLSAIGRKGGETKGKSKVRGDKDYYREIGKKGAEKRYGK